MKYTIFLSAILIAFLITFSACNKEPQKTEVDKEKPKTEQTLKVNTDELVGKISKFRTDTEAKLEKLTRKVIMLEGAGVNEDIHQKWEKMDVYNDGDKLVRIQAYPHKGVSERTEEFYFMDGKLVFVTIKDKGTEVKEGKDAGMGKEFYFDNDKLIKYVNNSGEESKNLDEEKKVYETKLPYEAKEFLGILNIKSK
jgi:hypothetical protein